MSGILINPYAVFTDVTAPTITSASSVSVHGLEPLAFSITTDEAATITIGGTDAAQVQLASNTLATSHTLQWVSNGTQDFTAPADSGADNVYDITITATDAALNASSPQSFAITVTANGDASFSSVKLLLGFEGTNGSTGSPGFTDESSAAHGTATALGNAQISTAQFKFGSSSYLGDGTGDGISFADSADWTLSPSANSDQFTLECFIRPAGTNNNNKGLMWQGTSVGTLAFAFWCNSTSNGNLAFWMSTAGTSFNVTVDSTGLSWTAGQWYHCAADKDSGGKIRVYRDGVMIASSTPANSVMFNSSVVLAIGTDSANGRSFNGHIDEVRITKGVARYASDGGFTPPAAAYLRF